MMFTGTHRSRFLGVEPTGANISWAGAAFFAFDGHVIRDLWVLGDLTALQAQLEAATRGS